MHDFHVTSHALLAPELGAADVALGLLVVVDVLRLDVNARQCTRLKLLATNSALRRLSWVMTFFMCTSARMRLKPTQLPRYIIQD